MKTFEEVVRESISKWEVPELPIEEKEVMKLRDSGRVAFLENRKSYENIETLLEDEKVPNEEKEVLKKSLTKYFERSQKYLFRYDNAVRVLIELREKKKVEKSNEEKSNEETK